jgi:hypothetical protein
MVTIEQKYPVGTVFTKRVAKGVTQECTVVDFEVTRNLAGEIVRARYVTSHSFLGQTILERDVVQTTIDRALWTDK